MLRRPAASIAGTCARVVVTVALAAATIPVLADELPAPVAAVFANRRVDPVGFSAFVQPTGAAAPVVEYDADAPRNPASTIKLVTTFAALDGLGPTYQWRTEAYADGRIQAGTLTGDLILKGYGDPYFVTERLWLFQRELMKKGVQKITGDLVIDNSWFAREASDPGDFDGQTYRLYNTLPDALLVNFQSVNFLFRPDPVRGRVFISTDPVLPNLQIQNKMRIISGGCQSRRSGISMVVGAQPATPRVTFSGALASSCPQYELNRSLPDASAYIYGIFKGLWQEQGGLLAGRARSGQVPPGKTPLLRFDSLPLAEVIRGVNKYSNNVMTRQIFLTLGAEKFGPPATLDKSQRAIQEILARRGFDASRINLDNGAGLSRLTRISTRELAQLLLIANSSALEPEFQASLSIAGLDGTTRRRFQNDPEAGQMHLKTGTLNGVHAIAGFVRSQSGQEYVVVSIANMARNAWVAQEAQDALLRWVYRR